MRRVRENDLKAGLNVNRRGSGGTGECQKVEVPALPRRATLKIDSFARMTLHRQPSFVLLRLLLAWPLSFAARSVLAQAADEPAAAVDLTEQRQVLELDLTRLYTLIQQDSDPTTKTTLLGHHRELARRANILLEKFDPGKYDELRYDINIQCQRLARKQAPLAMPPPQSKRETLPEIALHELTPSPGDKEEVKAALDAVDLTIKRLENRLGMMTIGSVQHQTERARVQRLKERRVALGQQFTSAGWDALAAELRPPGQ